MLFLCIIIHKIRFPRQAFFMPPQEKGGSRMKKYLNRLFIDGLSGMAYGLFSTLIIGTIICQIGKLVGGNIIGE